MYALQKFVWKERKRMIQLHGRKKKISTHHMHKMASSTQNEFDILLIGSHAKLSRENCPPFKCEEKPPKWESSNLEQKNGL